MLETKNVYIYGQIEKCKTLFLVVVVTRFNIIPHFFDNTEKVHIYTQSRITKGIRNCRIESFEGISLITKTLPEKNCFQLTKKSTSLELSEFLFSGTVKMKNKIKAKPVSLLLLIHSPFPSMQLKM